MLVELSVMEQRYQAVMEVLGAHVPVTEVAERYGSPARRCTDGSGTSRRGHRGLARSAQDPTLKPASTRSGRRGGDL